MAQVVCCQVIHSRDKVFFKKEDEANELKFNISNDEVDKLIKEYKKIKRNEKSNMNQIKKLGLVDKDGRPL